MSILINGMEMPETCEDCEFHRYHSNREYVCIATPLFYPMNLANSKGIRKDFCPLEEVPECEDAISRQAAIDALQNNRFPGAPYVDAGISIAIGVICELPFAQPDVSDINVGDMISRQAALDKFEPWLKVEGYSEGELNMLKAILEELKSLPSVQSDVNEYRKRGEWDMFELITSAWYGKQYYFKEDNGMVYSRKSHKTMMVHDAILEFIREVGDE